MLNKTHIPSTNSFFYLLTQFNPFWTLKQPLHLCKSSTSLFVPPLRLLPFLNLFYSLLPPFCFMWSFSSKVILEHKPPTPLPPTHTPTSSSHVSFLEFTLKVSLFMNELSPSSCLLMMCLVPPKFPQVPTSYSYLHPKFMNISTSSHPNEKSMKMNWPINPNLLWWPNPLI
jgi:hypothetical protein